MLNITMQDLVAALPAVFMCCVVVQVYRNNWEYAFIDMTAFAATILRLTDFPLFFVRSYQVGNILMFGVLIHYLVLSSFAIYRKINEKTSQ